jgi:multicomponent Na+:H+ antiporter subunit D
LTWLLVAPIAIPFAAAVLCYFARHRAAGRWISVAGAVLHLIAAGALMSAVMAEGVLVLQVGDWAAPFGITLVADYLGAAMVLVTAVTSISVAVYATADIDARLERLGYHTLYNVLIGGVTGAFVTGDLFNLYVWFEVMLIASFGLLVLGNRPEQIDGGIKYVALNLVSTVVFLTGTGLLYGQTGTLNMADLAVATGQVDQGLLTVIAMMFLVAFGMKAAVFPLFFWLPASYHTPAFAVSAVFAGLLTKVGVYAIFRTFTLIFDHDWAFFQPVLMVVAALTMLMGVLGAAVQGDMRKILSFHIVSQIGYMILGLALLTPLALAGAIFYILHHIIVKANLFLIAGLAHRLTGGTELARIGGLYAAAPFVAVLFLVPAFSLAGFPPLSGFWAKLVLVRGALEIEEWLLAGVALVVGLLTVFSMTKIWAAAFWAPHPDGQARSLGALARSERLALILPIAALAAITVAIGLAPGPLLAFATMASAQLLDPSDYIAAVLGGVR